MKTLIKKTIAIMATGLLLAFNANATEKENPKTVTITNAVKEIKSHITFPNFVQNYTHYQQELVTVVFTVNEAGQINLAIANTKNEELKKTIEAQFLKMSLKQLSANSVYSIQFNFKTV